MNHKKELQWSLQVTESGTHKRVPSALRASCLSKASKSVMVPLAWGLGFRSSFLEITLALCLGVGCLE